MPLGYSLAFPLGVPPTGLTSDQVLDLFVQLLPVKFAQWTGIVNKRGDVYNLIAAIADSLKAFCYDGIAIARGELNPAQAGYRLADYETWLGLTSTSTALSGSPAARRAQIISKMREQGASTVANIQAVLGPLLGYVNPSQLVIIEMSRSALTAAHTYANATGAVLGASGSVTQAVQVLDDGKVSDAGAQLFVTITCTNPEQLSFVLTGPTGANGQAVVTFPAGSLPTGAVTAVAFQLIDPTASPGKSIFAGIAPLSWTLQVTAGAAGCTLVSWSLFVEGTGRDANGYDGLGSEMHDWTVYADPTLVNLPSMNAAVAALQRIQPADSNVALVQNASAVPAATLIPPFFPRNV